MDGKGTQLSTTIFHVYIICHTPRFDGAHIWVDTGNSSNKSRRYININATVVAVGKGVSDSLPPFHAFTGCDHTSAFV